MRWHEHDATEIQEVCDKVVEQAIANLEEAGYKRSSVKIIGAHIDILSFPSTTQKTNRRYQSARNDGGVEPQNICHNPYVVQILRHDIAVRQVCYEFPLHPVLAMHFGRLEHRRSKERRLSSSSSSSSTTATVHVDRIRSRS